MQFLNAINTLTNRVNYNETTFISNFILKSSARLARPIVHGRLIALHSLINETVVGTATFKSVKPEENLMKIFLD